MKKIKVGSRKKGKAVARESNSCLKFLSFSMKIIFNFSHF